MSLGPNKYTKKVFALVITSTTVMSWMACCMRCRDSISNGINVGTDADKPGDINNNMYRIYIMACISQRYPFIGVQVVSARGRQTIDIYKSHIAIYKDINFFLEYTT